MFESDDYKRGQRDALVALLESPDVDGIDVRFAAYECRKISKAVVDDAIREAVDDE